MRTYNVAPQEGSMRVVQGTLLVVLTLVGLLIAAPIIFFGFALFFGNGFAWVLVLIAIGGLFAGIVEARQKQERAKYGITRRK